MKKIICFFCSLVIMAMCLSGCGSSNGNPFTSNDAKKGQIGDLYYVVPSNAVSDDNSNPNSISYRVPIENSVEEYILSILYTYVDEDDASSPEEVLEYTEMLIEFIEKAQNTETENKADTQYVSEDIVEFAGVTVDRGIKLIKEESGGKAISIIAVKSRKIYSVGYVVKTAFFDESIWDNFYNQLKIIESD